MKFNHIPNIYTYIIINTSSHIILIFFHIEIISHNPKTYKFNTFFIPSNEYPIVSWNNESTQNHVCVI
ncbi:hypothetical protein EYC84_001349 [Monilinia fructicola]|uniref:Uncharacterized protein n=1 Tax=Monilinia fructicola TaxID=38448 RepID=A0A5M9JJT6_MONFR|nr:hypothetical protein EYC84_001349 [Monilinia fructicola]